MPAFTHIDPKGLPAMVDVGGKPTTTRTARARAIVDLPESVFKLLSQGELQAPKGPVFQTAVIAGILAAKKTGELIPLCHPLGLDHCQITIEARDEGVLHLYCLASVQGKTGVEMEALTGVSIAALTVYDMCKALSSNIVIREIRLLEKTGGKKDFFYVE